MKVFRDMIHQQVGYLEAVVAQEDLKSISSNNAALLNDLSAVGNKDFMIIGWICRDLSNLLFMIKRNKTEKNLSKAFGEVGNVLKEINKIIDADPILIASFLDAYFEAANSLRVYLLTEAEKKEFQCSPEISKEFSREFTIELIDFLDNNKDLLLNENNDLIDSISSELYRVSYVYGGNEALVLHLVFLALSDYCDYFRYELGFEKNLDKRELLYKTKLDKYIEQVYKLRQEMVSSKIENLYDNANLILVKLGVECRNYRLIYGDKPYEKEMPVGQRIELPESVKKKISGAIAKSLDKELK
jgi:hypothetical protein